MRFICSWILFLLATPAWGQLDLPSSLTLMLGGDRQDSRNAALDARLSFANQWQLGLGIETAQIPQIEEDSVETLNGYRVSIESDPLALIAFEVQGSMWNMGDDVESIGGAFALMLNPGAWAIKGTVGADQVQFNDLPALLFPDRSSAVVDTYGRISLEYFFPKVWSVRATYSRHQYDKDLADYGEGLRVLFMPPSVLTTVTGFITSDAGLSAQAVFKALSVGVDFAVSQSELDEVKSRRVQLNGGYRLSDQWSAGLMLGTSKPEDSEEDARDNRYGQMSLTFQWR